MSGASVLSLFDVEDEPTPPKVREMTVGPATAAEVHEFCRRYHYTETGGASNWRFGLWHGPTLWGVVAYNLPTRNTCEAVFGPDHFDKVWHMGRLAMAENAPRNSESRLIGGSLRLIQEQWPNVWAVVTFAATDRGHIGYVYQATNARYCGTGGGGHYFVDQQGRRRADFLDAGHVTVARADHLGWARYPSGPKHRYIYILGNKRERRHRLAQLRWPILPYPKQERAA